MRVLLLLLCLLFAGCGTPNSGPHVQGPVQTEHQPADKLKRSTVTYNLGTSPALGRILPLPKGYYGYVTVKNYTGDALYLVFSKQVESKQYMHIVAEGIPFVYELSENQVIGIVWEKTAPYDEVQILIVGVAFEKGK